MKKAIKWLKDNNIEFTFHDVRKDGLDEKQILDWEKELGWEVLLNRRGMLWRKVDQKSKDAIDKASAIELMKKDGAIIKRPVLDLGDKRVVGFKEDSYRELFSR